uniref:Uncharacterized protein n=1 Tax=Avena sativa TaxID=4498 RepID=A0ACD5VKP1_AVESA
MVAAVHTAFAGDTGCPVPDFNVSASLALFPFNISAANSRLVFFYGCAVPSDLRLPRLCANRTMGAYVSGLWGENGTLPAGVSRNCSSASVPVRGGTTEQLAAPGRYYQRLIDDGFLLELPAPLGDCDGCTRMRGECRFDQFSFQCVCPDGNLCPASNSNQSNSTAHPAGKQSVFFLTLRRLFRQLTVVLPPIQINWFGFG